MDYEERRAARRAADSQKHKSEPPTRDPFYDLPADQRRTIRKKEEQGRQEAKTLVAIEERAAMQAAIEATPPHLRRPANVWRDLITQWQSASYRPDVAHKIKEYKKLAAERDREIEIEMAAKLREFEVANNPETQPAREHWERASAGADSETERQEWARLKGLIDGGATSHYWAAAQLILDARLVRMEAAIIEQAAKQAPLDEEARALAERQKATKGLQVVTPTTEATEDIHPLMKAWEDRTATAT